MIASLWDRVARTPSDAAASAGLLALRVAAVSGRLQRGRHTTRHVELFGVGPQALVADRQYVFGRISAGGN